MDMTQDKSQHIELIADDTLTQFEKVAEAAQNALRRNSSAGADAFASVNTMTSGAAVRNLGQISQTNRESYQILSSEPAIARVVVADEDDELHIYYICRTTAISGVPNLASYRSPVGRLASLPIGAEFSLPSGAVVEVLERTQLRPTLIDQFWDSHDTIVQGEDFGPITIESLRALLNKVVTTSPSVQPFKISRLVGPCSASAASLSETSSTSTSRPWAFCRIQRRLGSAAVQR